MLEQLTLDKFQSLSVEEKSNILRYQSLYLSELPHFSYENLIHKGNIKDLFQSYLEKLFDNLMYHTKCLKFVETSWGDFEAERIAENRERTQASFNQFFQGYVSTLASIEMLKKFENHDVFDHDNASKKLNLLEKTFELELTNFLNFHINEFKMNQYDVKILPIEEIHQKSKDLVQTFNNLQVIDLFDNKYRNYLRSRPDSDYSRRINFTESDQQFNDSIVDIDNLLNLTLFSNGNLISSLYTAYFDIYRVYRGLLLRDDSFKTFTQYKESRIASLKSVYFYEKDKETLAQKIAELDDEKLLEIYESNKNHYQTKGFSIQTLFYNTRKLFSEIFNIPMDLESIVLTLNDKQIITSEFNGYKFFAFPDSSVTNVSSEAYFGFSLPISETTLINKFEKMLSEGFDKIKVEVENTKTSSSGDIPCTNFYSKISMIEEFNADWVQKIFFANETSKSVEVISS